MVGPCRANMAECCGYGCIVLVVVEMEEEEEEEASEMVLAGSFPMRDA